MVEIGKLSQRITVNMVPKLAIKNIPKLVSAKFHFKNYLLRLRSLKSWRKERLNQKMQSLFSCVAYI